MRPVLVALCLLPGQAGASVGHGIVIVGGQFGTIGAARKLDIGATLQHLCGTTGDRCDVFCSETSFGRYRLGPRPICRVTYRCPDASVRSFEAAREEPILLRCGEESDAAAPEGMAQPQYSPPSGQ